MNLVRIFVNAAWWNTNVQVPIANQNYQTYIDTLIQRAKKYNNYVVILKAGQFPDAPCGASRHELPRAQSGRSELPGQCFPVRGAEHQRRQHRYGVHLLERVRQDVRGRSGGPLRHLGGHDHRPGHLERRPESVDRRHPHLQPAVAHLRRGHHGRPRQQRGAFESIVAGKLPDFSWTNLVWNFHLYAGPGGTCTTPASPRYANWSQNFDPLVTYAQQYGHAAAILEWGGCNDSEPYHTNITTYAQTHYLPLAYFDNTNLITADRQQLIN